jgi:hypothetical protein
MENNHVNVEPNSHYYKNYSHYYKNLDQLLNVLNYLEDYFKEDYEKTLSMNSPYIWFKELRKATENTIKNGYNLVKE